MVLLDISLPNMDRWLVPGRWRKPCGLMVAIFWECRPCVDDLMHDRFGIKVTFYFGPKDETEAV